MEEALQKALVQMQEEIGQKDKTIEVLQEQLRKKAYAMSGGDP
jgi:prefoldin subunit 5